MTLECIKFAYYKAKIIQIGNEWFLAVHNSGITVGVNCGTLRAISKSLSSLQ